MTRSWKVNQLILVAHTTIGIRYTLDVHGSVHLNINLIEMTRTLTANDENNLHIFERKILRKIFDPVNIDNIWIIRNSMEIDNLIEGADIVRFINP